jgi:hypothetical protein
MIKTAPPVIIFLLLAVAYAFHEDSGGDLTRIGKVNIETSYRAKFEDSYHMPETFSDLSELQLEKENDVDILVVGDSFSQQENSGFQNYLSSAFGVKTVNVGSKSYVFDNPIQFLFTLANGDLLDSLKVRYVVLESVERSFAQRALVADVKSVVTTKDLDWKFGRPASVKTVQGSHLGLGILEDIINYSLYNLLYNFNEKAFISPVYKTRLTRKLFSTRENTFLFYYEDIDSLKYCTEMNVHVLNSILNALSEKLNAKGTRLIVVPGPDKYDMYHDFIANNRLPKNLFFEYLNNEKKEYIYIDTKKLLLDYIDRGDEDIYYADDSHWSPIAAQIVARTIHDELAAPDAGIHQGQSHE